MLMKFHLFFQYNLIFRISLTTAAEAAIEKVLIEIKVGPKAASKIIKVISLKDEEETPEGKTVLLKLKKILDTDIVRSSHEQFM